MGMSVTGYFGRRSPAVETRWEREWRREMLREAAVVPGGRWERLREPASLDVSEQVAHYDPVLRAHCRVRRDWLAPR